MRSVERHPDRPREMTLLPLNPDKEAVLRDLGRAVEPLFQADEPEVSRDARSVFRRLLPDVTRNPYLLSQVPKFVSSLLYALDHLAPKYDPHRKPILAAWKEVEKVARILPPSAGAGGELMLD